jgi:antibiotic biosynthesis monooxygenase (ABM) superfamily enzyme
LTIVGGVRKVSLIKHLFDLTNILGQIIWFVNKCLQFNAILVLQNLVLVVLFTFLRIGEAHPLSNPWIGVRVSKQASNLRNGKSCYNLK